MLLFVDMFRKIYRHVIITVEELFGRSSCHSCNQVSSQNLNIGWHLSLQVFDNQRPESPVLRR
jgi:hypothetical protein